MIKSFRDLDVWKKSHELVLEIYRVTRPEFESLEKKLSAIAQMNAALSRSLKGKLEAQKGFSRNTGHGSRITNPNSAAN